jgi:PAS domain S-box-containing protein
LLRALMVREGARVRLSEQRLATILASVGDAVLATNGQGRIERMNPVAEQLTGWTLAEARGQSLDTVFHIISERTRERVESPFTKVLRAGQAVGLANHTLLIARNGREIPIEDSGAPIRGLDGQVAGVVLVFKDATGRYAAERALRESEEQLRLATEAAEVGLWDVDMLAGTLRWVRRGKGMAGISSDLPVSTAEYYRDLHPEDRKHTGEAFAAAIDPTQKALYEVEYRTVRKDGVIRWIAAKGRALFDGDTCVRVIGAAMDITARKATENELRELNERLEQRVASALAERKVLADIVEATDAFVQVVDLNFCFLAINRAGVNEFERIFGCRPKVGDNMLKLIEHRPEQKAMRLLWSRALAGEEFTAADEVSDPNIDRRYHEMKFNALRDRHGNQIGAFQFVYDVSERVRNQARLAEAEKHLRHAQKIDAIGQLTGGIAHDFNNLLMVISGGLSLLKCGMEAPRQERIMRQMGQAAQRGAALSRQLLTFARRQPLHSQPVDVRRQLDGMHELLDRTLRGDVHVKTEFPEDLWPVEVDPAELELVILNLCVNARDAMPHGGLIIIGGRNLAVKTGEHNGNFVMLTVADNGVGMPPEILGRVFEPFFTTKEIGKGSGLGLPQVHGFAEQSGGSVSVESVVGQGTTVTLLLPRSERTPRRPPSELADIESTDRRRALKGSILLVEDEDEVASLVTEMLRELGYRITRVASAQAALGALMDDRDINLVFTDVMMPGSMNGMDLATEVRRRWPHVRVLLTTGYAGSSLKGTEGEIAVLSKPYEMKTLDAALSAAIGRPKAMGD